MHTLTLLVKAYDNSQLGIIKDLLVSDFEGLKVALEILGTTSQGWVQVAISGEDENTVLNYFTREFGLCPERLESIGRFSTIKGRVTALRENKAEVSVDIGIFTPHFIEATMPLPSLQAQLADGRKVTLKKIANLFGLRKDLPLTIKTLNVNVGEDHVEAILAESQTSQYTNWIRSLLDRLIILGATLYNVKLALKKAECRRDIVSIESLGLLEQAVVCKLGTDAAGLIPKIGRQLHRAAFSVFNPRNILEFLQDNSTLLVSQCDELTRRYQYP